MKTTIIAIFISLFAINLFAEEDNQTPERPINYGIYLGGNLNMHSPDMNWLSGTSSTTSNSVLFDESVNSFGFNVGAVVNFPINRTNWVSLRLGYNGMNGDFDKDFYGFEDDDTTAIYNLENSVSYLEIAPMYQIYDLIPVKNLYLMAGLELGIPLSTSYDYNRDIDVVDASNSLNQEISSGDYTESRIRFAAAFGVGYMFDVNENFHIAPEVSFRFPFTDVVGGISTSEGSFNSWSTPQLRFGVNLTYSIPKKKEEKRESQLSADFNGVYYYDNGNREPVKKIVVEDVQTSELFPLLTNVFFEENKAVPANSSQNLAIESETGEFSIENLSADAIEINKSAIDIVGKRLQKYPNARIKITGTNNNKKEKLEVSKKRAEFVKNYISVNYGITPDRIDVDARNLPEKASSQKDPDGVEENRRIEITSNVPMITEPLIIEKDRQTFSTPNLIEFEPNVQSTDSIVAWTFEINQSGKLIRSYAGTDNPNNIQWNVQPNELKQSDVPIDYTLFVENAEGKTAMKSGSVPVEYYSFNRKKVEEKPDKVISKYSLVVFDFDSPEISEKDKEILKRNVIPAINYNSVIQIYGYSDRIGDESYNQKLALRRAEAVKKFLEPYAKSNKIEVYGIGENIEVFDNDLPIGRQLSRTVQIYVITPKEK